MKMRKKGRGKEIQRLNSGAKKRENENFNMVNEKE